MTEEFLSPPEQYIRHGLCPRAGPEAPDAAMGALCARALQEGGYG